MKSKEHKEQTSKNLTTTPSLSNLSEIIKIGKIKGYLTRDELKSTVLPGDESLVNGLIEALNITIFETPPTAEQIVLLASSSVPDVRTERHRELDSSILRNSSEQKSMNSAFLTSRFSPARSRNSRTSLDFIRPSSRLFESSSPLYSTSRPTFFTSGFLSERRQFSTAIDFASEPKYYYHSIGAMNPMKLCGVLKQGILSKNEAENRGLIIDANGIQCNGTHYVSTATHFGGCMNSGDGAFHFVIEREKLTTNIRKNPEQDMPTERQVYLSIPRSAIKAIQLEKEGFIDIEHPSIKLGIGCFEERATKQISTYVNFMASEFGYKIPDEDVALIQKAIHEMKTASSKYSDYFEQRKVAERLEGNIETLIKKHLKICFKKVIMKDLITPYDILRHYDKNIPVYDHKGNDINQAVQDSEDSLKFKPFVGIA